MVSEELFDILPDISANTCFWENPCKQFVPPKMDGVKTINLRIAALISINFHSTNDPSPTESKPPQQRKKTNQVTHDAISQLCFGQPHENNLAKQSKDWKIQWYPVVHKVWPSKIYHRWDMQRFIGSLCHWHLEKKKTFFKILQTWWIAYDVLHFQPSFHGPSAGNSPPEGHKRNLSFHVAFPNAFAEEDTLSPTKTVAPMASTTPKSYCRKFLRHWFCCSCFAMFR